MYKIIKIKLLPIFVATFCLIFFFGTIIINAVSIKSESIPIPIIMYHSILKDENYLGDYVISPDEFEKDLIYLKENGYTAIGITELLNYVNGVADLPEKPIILSFDDGYYNNYVYAYPLAQKYDTKIIISPIAYWSEQCSNEENLSAYYSHITWEQIEEMSNSGLVEFGNHSYNLHTNTERKGIQKLDYESLEDYRNLLETDITKASDLLLENANVSTSLFVYPFGAISEESPDIIKELGFSITFSCEEKTNEVTRDINSLTYLGRYLRPQYKSIEQILQ